jgi:hypothetical protein
MKRLQADGYGRPTLASEARSSPEGLLGQGGLAAMTWQ